MVGLKRSRLAASVDFSDDVVKYDKNSKGNSGRDYKTVEVDYFRKSYHRGLKDIDDSMKEYEHSNLSDVDYDYLEYLTSDLMSVRKKNDKKALNIDGTNNDPQYDIFWSCLKPYGTSCILEVSENNGLSKPIIYGFDGLDEPLNQKAKGTSENFVVDRKIEENNRVLRSHNKHTSENFVIDRKIEENKRVLRSHNKCLVSSKEPSVKSEGYGSFGKVDAQNHSGKGRGSYALRSNDKMIDKKNVETERDSLKNDNYASYKIRTETKCSNVIGKDVHDRVLNHETNKRKRLNANSSKEGKGYALRSRGNVIETKKVKTNVPFRKNNKNASLYTGSKVTSGNQSGLKGIREAKKELYQSDNDTFYVNEFGVCFRTCENLDDVEVGKGDDDNVYNRVETKRKIFNANSKTEGKKYALRSKGNVIETSKVEAAIPIRRNDKYTGFGTGLKFEGSGVISRDQPNLMGINEAEKKQYQSDDDTFYVNVNGVCFLKPEILDDVIVVEEDDDIGVYTSNSHGEINSDYRKELIENLRKPFNDKELKKLFVQISNRKPIDRHIDLRHGRAGSYYGNKEGKSYLDQYLVLKRKLDAAKDGFAKLNLLRGFFFWLQNLTRDKSFEPWNDKACLAVLPEAVRIRK